MAGQSKLIDSLRITCQEFQHPGTNHCLSATAGLLLSATFYCLRVYSASYAISWLLQHRVVSRKYLRRGLLRMIQSSAFLVTNAYTFSLYHCLLRTLLGRYHFATVAFIPCFLASLTAILVERPACRPVLTLCVANAATEALWKMAQSRGRVRSIPQGQTLIFGLSITTLLYLYRLGGDTTRDSMFFVLRTFFGKEAGPVVRGNQPAPARPRPIVPFSTISDWVRVLIHTKHSSCLHPQSCLGYSLTGLSQAFVGGVQLQMARKMMMNVKRLAAGRMPWREQILNRSTWQLGLLMGSFTFMYKAISCLLRHSFNRDDARFAIPAGLISSVAFTFYPNNAVALYVMWRTLRILCVKGQEEGILPPIPKFMLLFLYSFFTAVLLHAAILEPQSLRPSYYKFLQAISGDRLGRLNLSAFDVFGLRTQQQALDTIWGMNVVKEKVPPLPVNIQSTPWLEFFPYISAYIF